MSANDMAAGSSSDELMTLQGRAVPTSRVTPIPPGFSSLTSFTLQKVDDDRVPSECSFESADDITANDPACDILRQVPWIRYGQTSNIQKEETASDLFGKDVLTFQSLPKGVTRGCEECDRCQKVMARWRPQDAHSPSLDEGPVFHPSEEEFKDTLKYISSICPKAEQFGICRIVPPPSWSPPSILKGEDIWEFPTHVQEVHKLHIHDASKKIDHNQRSIVRKRQKFLSTDEQSNLNKAEYKLLRYSEGSQKSGFLSGPEFTLDSFQKYADYFKDQYFCKNTDLRSPKQGPTVENIEGEYWRIVEKPTEEIEVLYGSSLDTGSFNSGFPKASSSKSFGYDYKYINSGWNLNNVPHLSGSIFAGDSGAIPGVLVPLLHVGMCFSSFCWHVEDHHLYSLNYLHSGAPKVWYGVPGHYLSNFEDVMKKCIPDFFEDQSNSVHNLVNHLSPALLRQKGTPVYRCVQSAGEFVLTFPRAYHSSLNCGFNCAESVNVAPVDWLLHGQNAVELYRERGWRTLISHDKLLLRAASNVVKVWWLILFSGKNLPEDFQGKSIGQFNDVLARALKARIQMEHVRWEYLRPCQTRKMDGKFNTDGDKKCIICNYDLHLSAISCPCSPDKFACLMHAKQLCSCCWTTRLLLFRHDLRELDILLDAFGGKGSAVHRWCFSFLGLSLKSHVKKKS